MPSTVFGTNLTVTGRVTNLAIFGNGPQSGEFVVQIQPADGAPPRAYRLSPFLPAMEPVVFTAVSSMLSLAYAQGTPIQLAYAAQAGETPRILGVWLLPM